MFLTISYITFQVSDQGSAQPTNATNDSQTYCQHEEEQT